MSFPNTFHHDFYPFQNQAEIDRVRKITKDEIVALNGKHPTNPNIRLDVIRNDEFEMVMIADMVKRIVDSDRYDKQVVMIMCNPNPTYRKVAYMLHELNVNCRNVKFYMMDEWADEDGNIAPLSYKPGFGYAFEKFMVSQIMDLGFKRENFIYHSNEITPVYSKMLQDDGEADIVYSGPGWPGHLAFIDPVEDWFKPTMEEYLQHHCAELAARRLRLLRRYFPRAADGCDDGPARRDDGKERFGYARHYDRWFSCRMAAPDLPPVHLRRAGSARPRLHPSAPRQTDAYDHERKHRRYHRGLRVFPVLSSRFISNKSKKVR